MHMINFANNLILDYEKDSDSRISAICRDRFKFCVNIKN